MNLKELSRRLGLSQTTVSRALNGYPEVKEATRERVKKAAAEFGYRPSITARGLATGRSQTIGHVIPVSTQHEMMNPIFADFIAGAGESYAAAGYDMILSVLPDDQEENGYRALKQRRAVDGMVLHAPRDNDPRLDLLDGMQMPYVVHGRAGEREDGYSWVDVNNRSAFQRATGLLLNLGHRRIALINGIETMDFAKRRREGFERALASKGITPNPDWMISGEMTERHGYVWASRLLQQSPAPTAFLVSSMISAIGVRRAISRAGLQMGKDVSVITHDDALSYLDNGDEIPIFTATRSSVREAGRLVGAMLIDLINDPEHKPRHKLLEAQIVLGTSTGAAPPDPD